MDEKFPKSARLTGSRDFERVLRGPRRSSRNKYLWVYVARRPVPEIDPAGPIESRQSLAGSPGARLGLIVSKKVGNAVRRNRFKRFIREIFRHHRGWMEKDLDVVVRPQEKAATLAYSEFERVLLEALQGCGAIRLKDPGGRENKGSKAGRQT